MGNHKFSIENQRPEGFSNVKVFASTPRFQSQPGKIRHLKIESKLLVDRADQSDDDQPIDQNDDDPIGLYVTIGFVAFPTLMTLFGLVYMWKRAYNWRCCCSCTRINMEKQDRNLVYGDYYYADGTLSKNTVEVCFTTPTFSFVTRPI